VFIFLFFLFSIAVGWVAHSTGQGVDADPVSKLLAEYRKLSLAGASEAERIAKYEGWRQMLTVATRDNPSSASKRQALLEVVRICNALGDRDQSLLLLEELMDDESISLWEHYDLQMQHAAVSRMRFLINHPTSEEVCAEVIKSYEKSNDILNSLLLNTSGAPIHTQSTVDGKIRELLPFDRLSEQKIINFERMGSTLIVFPNSVELSQSAKDYFQRARGSLAEWGTPRANLVGRGIDLEHLASNEALAAAFAGDMQDCEKALQFLDTLDGKRWATSFYVDDIAQRAFLAKGKDPRDFLIQWVEQNKDDERTCILVCRIADSFFRYAPPDYIDLVFPYLELLVDGKYAEPLMKIEAKGIAQGNSGNYAMVLSYIVLACRARGDIDKATQYNSRLLEMFPNYGGLTTSAKIDAITLAREKEARDYAEMFSKPQPRAVLLRFFLIAVGLSMCAYALYKMYRRRMEKLGK